jgi:hypothetical protein
MSRPHVNQIEGVVVKEIDMAEAGGELLQFNLTVEAGADAPADQVDELTRQLYAELGELGVEAVSLAASEPAPEGAKSAEALTIGALAVAVLPTFLPKLVEYLQAWALRGESRKVHVKSQVGDRSVEIEYSPSAISTKELERLVGKLTDALTPKTEASLSK